jgi:DNA-binding NtrC family response regulator
MSYKSVLIIEDDNGRMRLCKDAFSRVSPDTEVTAVDNLSDALRSIEDKKYSLYFCDCDFYEAHDYSRKPKKGAFFDFYKKLKEIHQDAKVIVCSNLEENVKKARELGLSAHLKGSIFLGDIASGKAV